MSGSVSLVRVSPCAGGRSGIRLQRHFFFTLSHVHRHPSSFSAICTRRIANVVRATTPGSADESQTTSSPPASSSATGVGFGDGRDRVGSRNRNKGNRKSKVVVRRDPVQKPLVQPAAASKVKGEGAGELPQQEKAFLVTWLGLGFLVLVEGIGLAASGFLPEEWDNLFVKYLYPAFTPTVVLFLVGAVAYGVVKYLDSGKNT